MGSRIRVLIADDHDMVRTAFASLLGDHEGLDVVGLAEDGEVAVELAELHQPDVVLMDYRMPKLTGPQATERIVAARPETKVIGLSMSDSDEMASQMLAAGAVACVSKTIDCASLIAAIREAAGCAASA